MTTAMRKLISGWTEQHVPVALALVVAVLGGAVATTAPAPYSFLSLAAVVVTVVGALFLDAFGGLVLGVAGSAVVVLGMRLGDRWTPESFPTSLAQVLSLVVLGWLVGMVSAGIHARREEKEAHGRAATPAYGSLGLLTEEVARARLEEEVARARSHGRPLSLVVIRVSITDQALDPGARDAASAPSRAWWTACSGKPCPVVVVHPARPAPEPRVVVGLDETDVSHAALTRAVEEAGRLSAVVAAVVVASPFTYWSDAVAIPQIDDQVQNAQRRGEHVVERVLGDRHDVRIEVVGDVGSPGDVLVRQAEGASLLVVGSRSRSQLTGMLLGSVALHSTVHAPYPVMVVHPEPDRAATEQQAATVPALA